MITLAKRKFDKQKIITGIGFAIAAILVCTMFAWFGQKSTADTLFSICFERQDSDVLLEKDEHWYGTQEQIDLRSDARKQGEDGLEQFNNVLGMYTTETGATLFTDGELSLSYTWYDRGYDKTVILLHGYNRASAAVEYAAYWTQKDVNILIPDMRGYGDGIATTLGWYEQFDLYDLIAHMSERYGCAEFIVHGEGSGAAAALLLSGNERYMSLLSEEGISLDLIVAEGCYTTLMELLTYQQQRQLDMSSALMSSSVVKSAINQYLNFNADDASVIDAVAESGTPTLFITASDDEFIPTEMNGRLYDACRAEKRLLVVDCQGHGTAFSASLYGGGEYARAIDEFIDQ